MRKLLIGVAAVGGVASLTALLAVAVWLAGLQPPQGSSAINGLDYWAERYQALLGGLVAFAGAAGTVAVGWAALKARSKELADEQRRFGIERLERLQQDFTDDNAAFGELTVALEGIQTDLACTTDERLDETISRLRNSAGYYRVRQLLPWEDRVRLESVLWQLERRRHPHVVAVTADDIRQLREMVNARGAGAVRRKTREFAELMGIDTSDLKLRGDEEDHAAASPAASDGAAS